MVIVLIINDAEGNPTTIFGVVKPIEVVDFPEFENSVKHSWDLFQKENGFGEVEIEDFVEFHNKRTMMNKIDWDVFTTINEN